MTTSSIIDAPAPCLITCLLLCVTVTACNSDQQLADDLNSYQERLANVLKIKPPENTTNQSGFNVVLPPVKELETVLAPLQIKFLDLFEYGDCHLSTLIAERNTALGRVQYPSTRYIYEVQLLEAIDQCLEQHRGNNTLLLQLKSSKHKQLPSVWANLMQTSSEMRAALIGSHGYIRGSDADGLNQSMLALEYLLSLQSQPQANSSVLEHHLKQLETYTLPANLWRSQQLLATQLKTTTQWLMQQTAIQQQCDPTNSPPQQVVYLSNVFSLFFVDQIQPVASRLNHYQYQLSPLLIGWANNPLSKPALAKLLKYNSKQGFRDYQQAMQEHILFWQQLFKQCGIKQFGQINSNQ